MTRKLPQIPFRFVLAIITAIIFLSILGLLNLKAEIYSLSVLSKNNRSYQDHQFIQSKVGSYFPLEFTVDISVLEPANIKKWIDSVYSQDEIGAVISYRQLPPFVNAKKIGYQSKFNPDLFRVSFLTPLMSTIDGLDLITRINKISSGIFSNAKPEITGFMTLYAQVADDLFNSFKQSLVWAVILISFIFMIFLRNWKAALIAIIGSYDYPDPVFYCKTLHIKLLIKIF